MDKITINRRFIDSVSNIIKANPAVNKGIIAESLGISKSKFSEILNFRMNANIDLIAKFCTVYNVDANWLLTGNSYIPKFKFEDETVSAKNSRSTTRMNLRKHLLKTIPETMEYYPYNADVISIPIVEISISQHRIFQC